MRFFAVRCFPWWQGPIIRSYCIRWAEIPGGGWGESSSGGGTGVMEEFASFLSVIGLWIGLSVALWWMHRARIALRHAKKIELAERARGRVTAARGVFDSIRDAGAKGFPAAELQTETFALLRRVEKEQPYFDTVNALHIQIRRTFKIADCEHLAEILHLRRDLWAASEILLMEDLRALGEDFAADSAVETFRAEAVTVLFKSGGKGKRGADSIDLRLKLAREEADKFVTDVRASVRSERENERLPTIAEVIAYPIAAARKMPGYTRAAAAYAVRFARYVLALARRIRDSEAMALGAAELQRAREELPQRVTAGVGKASEAARQGAAALQRHYQFLMVAHDVQAKYEELLSRRPDITERGRQFFARLELAAQAERLRLTSASVWDWLKRRLVSGLAHLIAGLQRLKDWLDEVNAEVERRAAEAAKNGRQALPAPSERKPRALDTSRSIIASAAKVTAAKKAAKKRSVPSKVRASKAAPGVDAAAATVTTTRTLTAMLVARLAEVPEPEDGDEDNDGDGDDAAVAAAAVGGHDTGANDDAGDGDNADSGPLTRGVMDMQAKLAAKPDTPVFPWLRR